MDAAGNKVAERVNDVWRFAVYDAFGRLVADYGGAMATDEGGVKFVQQDIQGSTRCVTSISGSVLARMDYQAFGEQISSGIGQRTTSGYTATDTLRNRYALTERDEATGLDDTWFRKLENRGGRWTSPDPYNGSANIGNGQSWNRYSYVENQPTNSIDPSGLTEVSGYACYIDGMLSTCTNAFGLLGSGAGVFGPLNTTLWDPDANLGRGEWQFFRAFQDGGRWVNMQGYSVSISVSLTYGIMSWYGGSAYYSSVPGLNRFDYYQPPLEPPGPISPPFTPQPPGGGIGGCTPEKGGTLDFNLSGGMFVGVQMGVQINSTHAAFYVGPIVTVGPAGAVSVTGSGSRVAEGTNYSVSGAFVAAGGLSGPVDIFAADPVKKAWDNTSFSFGSGTPSASAGLYRAFKGRHTCK